MHKTLDNHRRFSSFENFTRRKSPDWGNKKRTYKSLSLTMDGHISEERRLENDLQAYKFSKAIYKTRNPETDFEEYKKYVEGIALLIKLKDLKLGASLIKGIIAMGKSKDEIVQQCSSGNQTFHSKVCITKNKDTQTDAFPEPDIDIEYNLETIKLLQKRIKNMDNRKIDWHLTQILKRMAHMYTEVPEPTAMPEFSPLEIVEDKKSIQEKPKEIIVESATKQYKIEPLKIDKSQQISENPAMYRADNNYYEERIKEQISEIFNLKHKISVLDKEKENIVLLYKNYKENLAKSQEIIEADKIKSMKISQKLNEAETYLHKISIDKEKLEEEVTAFKDKHQLAKEVLDSTKINNSHKVFLLQKLENKRFLCEVTLSQHKEKLNYLEQLYLKSKSRPIEYETITDQEIIRKYGLRQKNYIDKFKNEIGQSLEQQTEDINFMSFQIAPELRTDINIHVQGNEILSSTQEISDPVIPVVYKSQKPSNNTKYIPSKTGIAKKNTDQNKTSGKANPFISNEVKAKNTPKKRLGDIDYTRRKSNFQAKDSTSSQMSYLKARSSDNSRSTSFSPPSLEPSTSIEASQRKTKFQPQTDSLQTQKTLTRSNPPIPSEKVPTTPDCSLQEIGSLSADVIEAIRQLELLIERKEIQLQAITDVFPVYLSLKDLFAQLKLYQAIFNTKYFSKSTQFEKVQEEKDIPKRTHSKDLLLIKYFSPEEIESVPSGLRIELLNAMRGHKALKCRENCVHLQKALIIKKRSRGIPYPINYKFL